MPVKQGELSLLQTAASKELLNSTIPMRLAYVGSDGAPRVVPIWFYWNGRDIVLGTAPKSPKVKALRKNPRVALTLDENGFPPRVLSIRGTARLDTVPGVAQEYALAAERYLGVEQGKLWVKQLISMSPEMVRITITPDWVGYLDFQTRFPSALPL